MRGLALLSLVLACRIPNEHFVVGDAAGNPSDGSAGIDAATDAGSDAGDAGTDAGSAVCDDTEPFGSAVAVVGLAALGSVARLSANELTAYYGLVDGSGAVDIYQATRSSIGSSFADQTELTSLDDGSGQTTPYVSGSGLEIVYTHGSGAANTKDIWYASRGATDDEFLSPAVIANINGSGVEDDYASLASNGDLWFSSKRGSDLVVTIYRAQYSGGTWETPSAVTVLESGGSAGSYYPVLTQNLLHIYFARLQTGTLPFTIYEASRANAADAFSPPVPVASLQAGSDVRPAWISPDDCRLYVGSGAAGIINMAVATRP